MKGHTRVVVIGGGIVGANILYHLAKLGWSDAVLLEQAELTSGSTWHAAGLLPLYSHSYTLTRIIDYSIKLYESLEEETGHAVGLHKCGQLRLAATTERLDEYRKYVSLIDTYGVRAHLLTPEDIQQIWPLIEKTDRIRGGVYHPDDGHIAPADVTEALASGARKHGAQIEQRTKVIGITRARNDEWKVKTTRGDIVCEHVVSATGNYARQTAEMIGLDIPVVPLVHQYLVTDEVPEISDRHRAGLPEMPVLRDEVYDGYLREEGTGLLFGPYDRDPPLFAVDGMPEGFAGQLLPPDYDCMEPHIKLAIDLVPALGQVGVKTCVTGPIATTPDNLPLLGPAWGLTNYWLAEGVAGGVQYGGGLGRYLAEWMIEGEPTIDVSEVDPRRYGPYANKRYTCAKNKEIFAHNFGINYPDHQWPIARPLKASPCYAQMTTDRAVWGVDYGWEVPVWFAPKGVQPMDAYSYRRSNYFPYVGEECIAVRTSVGLMDFSAMSKFEVSGAGAEAYLDNIFANRVPSHPGRIRVCHLLTPNGKVLCEFTVTRIGPETFYLVASPRAERLSWDLLNRALGANNSVTIQVVTARRGVFVLAGPKARELLAQLTDDDLSNDTFPWLSARTITVGYASDVRALRINYVGELGWELHHPIENQVHLYRELSSAGRALGLRLVGTRAVESLRLEKSYRALWRDLTCDNTAFESGLHRFIRLDKGPFVGRDALLQQRDRTLPQRLVVLQLDCDEADAYRHEAVYRRGEYVGRVSSGGHAHWLAKSLAHAYVSADCAETGTQLEVAVLGKPRPAMVIDDSPYDPLHTKPRS